MKGIIVSLLLFVFLVLVSTGFAAEYQNLPLTKELVRSGVAIVDIRTEREWQETGVVPGSVLITFFKSDRSYDLDAFIAELGQHVDPQQDLAILCRRGNRSAKLAALMADRGFTKIINLRGGIRAAAANGVNLVHYPVKN